MNKKDIDSIAWLLKRAKDNNQPKPIVFLGAGASVSAGIPGSTKILEDILRDFKNKPEIKKLDLSNCNYYNVMACLNTNERHELLRNYITHKDVKINVTHIYLAQMLKEGWIDYILTVNFDDLILRACALFNFIPPVYDISILKDFTTTTLLEKSVTYLHGQHHGFWLLNTDEELQKVQEYIPTVLDRICNKRTWIIVGYSGEDPIFNQIARLGHFTNELFWIGYNEVVPSKVVQEELLDKANSNASWVSDYDADTFFLKLHSLLKMETPDIFNRPFSFLKGLMENIRDIEEKQTIGEHRALFESVKKRYDVSRKQVYAAIKLYEESDPSGALTTEDIGKDQMKQEIIETTIKGKYENAHKLLQKVDKNDLEARKLLSKLFSDWGHFLFEKAEKQNGERYYLEAIKKYPVAVDLDPKSIIAYNDWGVALNRLARLRSDKEIYEEAIEKFSIAEKLSPKNSLVYDNLSISIASKAKLLSFDEAKPYFKIAIEKAKKAVELGHSAYNLSCYYALLKEKKEALYYLEDVLKNKEDDISKLLNDSDWEEYLNDDDFKKLIQKYSSKN